MAAGLTDVAQRLRQFEHTQPLADQFVFCFHVILSFLNITPFCLERNVVIHLNPKFVSNFPKHNNSVYGDILIVKDIAYVFDSIVGDEFIIVDKDTYSLNEKTDILNISNPQNIKHISSIYGVGKPIALVGEYLYTRGRNHADGFASHWLNIIDISDIHNPKLVSSINHFGSVNNVAIQGYYLFLSTSEGLIVADIFDPSNPIEVGRGTDGIGKNMIIKANYLYYAGSRSVGVYDISDPTSPILVGSNKTIIASGISLFNEYVYFVGDGYKRIHVFETWGK